MQKAERIIIREIEKIRSDKRVTVGIDGRCGAGKTTIANKIAKLTGAAVFHADDYFLRPEQRTSERLSQTGGNLDFERLQAEVLSKIKTADKITYRAFDCHTGKLSAPITVTLPRVVIVEGSYCCQPRLWDYYDLRIFLDVDKQTQNKRILARNGDNSTAFFEKWIPLEEIYIKKTALRDRCDIVIK